MKSASEMREQTLKNENYKIEFETAVNRVMRQIEYASEKGYRSTCFNPSCYWYEDVKELFKKQGYTFKPTGYIGGVWQRTEEICW